METRPNMDIFFLSEKVRQIKILRFYAFINSSMENKYYGAEPVTFYAIAEQPWKHHK